MQKLWSTTCRHTDFHPLLTIVGIKYGPSYPNTCYWNWNEKNNKYDFFNYIRPDVIDIANAMVKDKLILGSGYRDANTQLLHALNTLQAMANGRYLAVQKSITKDKQAKSMLATNYQLQVLPYMRKLLAIGIEAQILIRP